MASEAQVRRQLTEEHVFRVSRRPRRAPQDRDPLWCRP
jgi:hypothetical protein